MTHNEARTILQAMRCKNADNDQREALRKAIHALLDEEIFELENPFN